jgi:hypothetical protein
MNDERKAILKDSRASLIERANATQRTFYTEHDLDEFVRNLCADLRHYCDAHRLDYPTLERDGYVAYCRDFEQVRADVREAVREAGLNLNHDTRTEDT